jgi:hypothetical protein
VSGRTSRRTAGALALACGLVTACGGGPSLSHLRCRRISCQDPERPLVLLLAVDFSDASGTLGQGTLDLQLGGATQSTQQLAPLFAAQGLDAHATQGTLSVDQAVELASITSHQQFTIGMIAHDGSGQATSEPSMTLQLDVTPDGGTP